MLFNSKYRYYEFFYTHLGQTLSKTNEGLKVKDWLRINIEHIDEDYLKSRPLTLLAADSIIYNPGSLTISIPNGSFKLDSSLAIPNNNINYFNNSYRTNNVETEVIDFRRVWQTPLIRKPNLNDDVLDAETFGTNQATESDSLFSEIFFGDADFSDYLTKPQFVSSVIDTFTYKDNRFIETREYPKVIKSPKFYDEEKDIWKLYTADSAIVTDIELENNKKFIRQELLQVPISSNNIIEYEENKTKRILPWRLTRSEFYKNPYSYYSWLAFTADAEIKNNQAFIGDDELKIQPRSTSGEYFIKLSEETTDINSYTEKLLTTDLLPIGLTTVDYKGLSSTSKSWVGLNRGYTPADSLTEDMKSGKTINVAIGILTLIELKEDKLLTLVIRELTHLWKYVLNNVVNIDGVESLNFNAIPGFPHTIPRVITESTHSCYLEDRRTTLDNAWLGYALTKAATYLADRKVEDRITLSTDVANILEQLAQFIAGCISPATGLCTPGYDDFGYLIAELDYQASVMASLFLRSYLTINYSNFVHGITARLKVNLDRIYEIDSIAEINTRADSNIVSIYTYLVIYAFVNGYQYRLLDITTKLINFLKDNNTLTTPFYIKDVALANYALDRAKVIYNTTSILLDEYLADVEEYLEIDLGLYAMKEETYPSFLTSSLTILKELNADIFSNYYFSLLESEAELLTTVWYNSGIRLYPYGYGWLKEEQLKATTSAIGAFMYSAAYSTFETACYISLLKSSVSIRNSQGPLLNAWGDSIRRPRLPFMSDFYYRDYVSKEMLNPLSLVKSLASYINNNYGEDIIVYNPELPKIIYSFLNNNWIEIEIGTSAYTEALLKGNSIEPGFYKKTEDSYVFVKWADYTSKVYVASVGYYKDLSKEVTQSLSTGVQTEIVYYLPFVGISKDLGYFSN